MNGCHQDAGHQCQQWMLYLLQDQFWWPGMAMQMQKAISNCKWFTNIRHSCQGTNAAHHCHHSFGATTHRCHKHQDDYGAPTTTKCGVYTGFSAITLQNMSWLMWPLTKLWRPLLNFCGRDTSWSLELWPSSWANWGTNFKSNIIKELCELIGIWKISTSPYHAQINGQVEQADEMLIHMIGKLNKDQRWIGPSIYQSWYILTILQDWPLLGTAHITWCSGTDHAYPSTSTSLQ